MGQRSSLYLAELVRRGLSTDEEPQPSAPGPAASIPGAIGPGEPSPGAVCMGPGCWEKSTSRYGLRRLPLCPACAAALQGRVYQRAIPDSAARLINRGAA